MRIHVTHEQFVITLPHPLEHKLTVSLDAAQFATFLQLFTLNQGHTERKLDHIMAAIDDLKQAQAAEHDDLAALAALITQLLTAFVNGTITPSQASDLLNEMNNQDSTIKTTITSIQAVLTPTEPPAPTPVP